MNMIINVMGLTRSRIQIEDGRGGRRCRSGCDQGRLCVLVRGGFSQDGFTLIELIIVIGVIVTLMGLAMGVYLKTVRDSEISRTRMLIDTLITQIEGYDKFATLSDGTVGRLWSIGQDPADSTDAVVASAVTDAGRLQMDGDPQHPSAPSRLRTLAPTWYRGPARMFRLPDRFVDGSGRLIDAWGNPLHLVYNETRFPDLGYGIWSAGRDEISDPFTETSDDIRSWTTVTREAP